MRPLLPLILTGVNSAEELNIKEVQVLNPNFAVGCFDLEAVFLQGDAVYEDMPHILQHFENAEHGTLLDKQTFHQFPPMGPSIGLYPDPCIKRMEDGRQIYRVCSHGMVLKSASSENVYGFSCSHSWVDEAQNHVIEKYVTSPAYLEV